MAANKRVTICEVKLLLAATATSFFYKNKTSTNVLEYSTVYFVSNKGSNCVCYLMNK